MLERRIVKAFGPNGQEGGRVPDHHRAAGDGAPTQCTVLTVCTYSNINIATAFNNII